MRKGQQHSIASRLKMSVAASRRWQRERKRRDTAAELRRAVSK